MKKIKLLFSFLAILGILVGCSTYQFQQGRGIYHKYEKGQKLEDIAKKYGIELQVLLEANLIIDPSDLPDQALLFIPTDKEQEGLQYPDQLAGDFHLPVGHLIWPSPGDLTSQFGQRWGRKHEGIDMNSAKGRDIVAAASGTVEFAGRQSGYGKTVIINHGSGITTLYAHNESIYVKVGQKVRQGQKISLMGSTGRSTGVHLHFEVRIKGQARDPLRYLPKR